MANAYKYRPQYTQNTIGPDPSGPGSGERVGNPGGKVNDRVSKVLERVAADWVDTWFNAPAGEQLRMKQSLTLALEERLGPLLRAGQAMRDRLFVLGDSAEGGEMSVWTAALAALETETGHEKAG